MDFESVTAAVADKVVLEPAVHAGIVDRPAVRGRVGIHDPGPAAVSDVHPLDVDLPVQDDDPVRTAGAVAFDGEVPDGQRLPGRRSIVQVRGGSQHGPHVAILPEHGAGPAGTDIGPVPEKAYPLGEEARTADPDGCPRTTGVDGLLQPVRV